MDIKVLWIDDQPNEPFMDKAADKGIYIINKENVDDGIDELLHSSESYDAIIIDANGNKHRHETKEEIEISALNYALRKISEYKINIPWFVYSAGGENENIIEPTVKAYEREYDSKCWYRKPSQMNELFEQIKLVASESALYKLKAKYSDVCDWYPDLKELAKILKVIESEDSRDTSIFNLIRKELDWIMGYCFQCGLLQKPYIGSELAECSQFLGDKRLIDYVPLYVQRAFHTTTSICNEGSHRLKIDALVKTGKAPYLVHSVVSELLNIIHWAKQLPVNEADRNLYRNNIAITLKEEVSPVAKEEYEGHVFSVEQDESGNYHCGECVLSYTKADGLKGRQVILKELKPNKSKTKDLYRFFVDFEVKD